MMGDLFKRNYWLVLAVLLAAPMAATADNHEAALANDPGAGEEQLNTLLPEDADPEAVENAEYGLEQARDARADGRAYGAGRVEDDNSDSGGTSRQ